MEENENLPKSIKLVFLGDSRVGKTSLYSSILDSEFADDVLKTIGNEGSETRFTLQNGHNIKLTLWDTPGQERFRSVSLYPVKVCHGIIFVFELTSRKSFENINVWLDLVKEVCTNQKMVLFGNKADEDKSKWQVTREEIEAYAKKMNFKYFDTSAKTGQGVDEGISYIVNESYPIALERVKNLNIKLKRDEDEYVVGNGCLGKKKKIKKRRKENSLKII